jgi:hypothetical protein
VEQAQAREHEGVVDDVEDVSLAGDVGGEPPV